MLQLLNGAGDNENRNLQGITKRNCTEPVLNAKLQHCQTNPWPAVLELWCQTGTAVDCQSKCWCQTNLFSGIPDLLIAAETSEFSSLLVHSSRILSWLPSWGFCRARAFLRDIKLEHNQLSNAVPYWTALIPLIYAALSYAAPQAMMNCTEQYCTLWARLHSLSYTASSEPSCTLLSYATASWAKLHPAELYFTLLSSAASYWAMLHVFTLLTMLHPPELSATLLSWVAPFWGSLDLLS